MFATFVMYRRWLWGCLAALLACGALQAQEQTLGPNFQAMAQQWAQQAVAAAAAAQPAAPLRMEVVVGNLDSRLRLAPCGNIEPYLPPGTRLWGRSRVGLRCVDGVSRWNVTLPVTVNAYGRAWVIKGQVASGAVLNDNDVTEAEVNWAEETGAILKDPALWRGQVATRVLSTGQPLRQGMVRPAQVFAAGAQVRVVAQGAGFQIATEAQALSGGTIGQLTRVRLENGRVSSGTVLDGRTVRIDL